MKKSPANIPSGAEGIKVKTRAGMLSEADYARADAILQIVADAKTSCAQKGAAGRGAKAPRARKQGQARGQRRSVADGGDFGKRRDHLAPAVAERFGGF